MATTPENFRTACFKRVRSFFLHFILLVILCRNRLAMPLPQSLLWDYTIEHWEDFHIRHCGKVCVNGSLVELNSNLCPWPECFECSCHHSCSILDTCCPHGTMQPDGSFKREEHLNPTVKSATPNLSKIRCAPVLYSSYFRFLQVLDCPRDGMGLELVGGGAVPDGGMTSISELCTQDYTTETNLDQTLPYLDVESGLVFRNKYCALCNGYSISMNNDSDSNKTRRATLWELKVTCKHYQELFNVTSRKQFVESAKEKLLTCSVMYETPENAREPTKCYSVSTKDRSIDTCEDHVKNTCLKLNNTYLSLVGYRNIFCLMCAGLEPVHDECSFFGDLTENERQPPLRDIIEIAPLSLLLGVTQPRDLSFSQDWLKCSSDERWFDTNGECQPALCPPGKVIDESGKCLSAINQIRGLGYKLFVVLRPRKPQMVTSEDIQNLSNRIFAEISDISVESIVDIHIAVWHHDIDTSYGKLRQVTVSAYLVGNDTIGRDQYEEQLLSRVSGAWVITRANGSTNDISMKAVLIGEELREFEETDNEDVEETIQLPLTPTQPSPISGIQAPNALMFTTPPATTTFTTPVRPRKVMYTQSHKTTLLRSNLWRLRQIFIDVTHSLACPAVPVNITNSTISAENLPKMSFSFLGDTIKIKSTQNIAVVKGQVQLCTSFYKKLTTPVLTRTKQTVLEKVQYYMEVVCVSLSVTCLLFSSLTYCLFPSLRSLPGMNNLSLCASLAVAQVCLLVTARWGINKGLPQEYCLAHAVVLHYSWLASFAWMSVCCIHMFRVFTARDNKFTDNRSDKRRYLQYCFYGFGVPALLVISTYAVNAVVTSGESSGYNGDICFLDTRRSTWTLALALLAPLCLVILTNGVMFVLTVREIVHVSNLQEHRRSRERQGVLTYVKLSTLTGLLGAVVVIAVQLNNSVVSMLTSPLMALQGVFIFVSFTCNQRVRQLYLDLFRRLGLPCVSDTEKSTSSGSTAGRTSSSNPSKRKTDSTRVTSQ